MLQRAAGSSSPTEGMLPQLLPLVPTSAGAECEFAVRECACTYIPCMCTTGMYLPDYAGQHRQHTNGPSGLILFPSLAEQAEGVSQCETLIPNYMSVCLSLSPDTHPMYYILSIY